MEEIMSISTTEIKSIFEMNREELDEYNQTKLLEFKELFLTTDLPVDEIYTKINVDKNDPTYRYIQSQRGKNGLSAKGRNVNFEIKEQSTEERYNELEEFYQEFKKIWVENPTISKKAVYEQLGKLQKKERVQYVNQRMKEDDLPNHFNTSRFQKKPDEKKAEEIYQRYKELFETTNIPLKEVREQLRISDNTNNPLRKYIIERSKEDGLDGRKRNIKQQRKKNPRVKKAKKKTLDKKQPKKHTYERKSKFSATSYESLEKSQELLQEFYRARNVKQATQKGYHASLTRWFEYTGGKYSDLQENIDFYMKEEDEKIPMRDRAIKKEMLGFREWLIEDKLIKSDKSARSYFSKVGTIFRHYGLEIPQLPQVKMEKGYVSSYNDLPTHDMIKTACEQSPLDLKALILFMSSSGSAKAETLSITVGMFLEGCNEYLEEKATSTNIQETLKALTDKHDIVPMIYLRRIKTDKWYYTCCSPEASYMIIESLKTRKNLKWSDELFDYTSSLILARFQEINDNNNWGLVGAYRRFRSHALRKFMASNIGLPRDQVDSFQGRSKDMIQEAYFKQDPKALKQIYLEAMHRVMVYENWGHGTTPSEIEQRAKRVKNGFNDGEKIVDLSIIPETPDEIKTSVGLKTNNETTVRSDKNSRNVNHNSSNSMPVTAPAQVQVGTIQGISISKELLQYAELMEKGLLSIGEFNRVKQKLLIGVLR